MTQSPRAPGRSHRLGQVVRRLWRAFLPHRRRQRIVLTWASNKYVFMVGYDLGTRLYECILHQPSSFHVSTNTSEVVASLQKVQLVTSIVLSAVDARNQFDLHQRLHHRRAIRCRSRDLLDSLRRLRPDLCRCLAFYQEPSAGERRDHRAHAVSLVQTVQEGLGGFATF